PPTSGWRTAPGFARRLRPLDAFNPFLSKHHASPPHSDGVRCPLRVLHEHQVQVVGLRARRYLDRVKLRSIGTDQLLRAVSTLDELANIEADHILHRADVAVDGPDPTAVQIDLLFVPHDGLWLALDLEDVLGILVPAEEHPPGEPRDVQKGEQLSAVAHDL